MKHIRYMLCMLLILTSCSHKELCYLHPHTANVRFDVDWSGFKKETPTGMTMMVYPESSGDHVRHLTNTITHAVIPLEAGVYNTIVFNQSDTEYGSVSFVGMEDYHTAEVRTVNVASRWYASRAEDEILAMQPEWIGTDCCTGVEVTPEMVEAAGEDYMIDIAMKSRTRSQFQVASHTPQNIIHTITVKVHLKGIYNLRSARASLTGLAGGYSFSKGQTTGSKVTQLLESWTITQDPIDPTQGYISSEITSMGLPAGHGGKAEENEFMLSVLLVDNQTIVDIPFMVGDNFTKVIDQEGNHTLELHIDLSSDEPLPDVEPSGAGGGGFNAKVDDWGEEHNVEVEL